jgi:hypothetical protein
MADDRPTRRKRAVAPHEIGPDNEGALAEDGPSLDATRHYQQDPDHLADFGRDEDDPHQPERE